MPNLRVPVLVVALLIAMLMSGIRDWQLTAIHSGFVDAARYVENHRSTGALAFSEVIRFYLRDPGQGCDAPAIPENPTELRRLYLRGYDYVIINRHTELRTQYLSRYARQVAAYPAPNVTPFGENLIDSENGILPTTPRADRVRIYRLNAFRGRRERRDTLDACSLDQLG